MAVIAQAEVHVQACRILFPVDFLMDGQCVATGIGAHYLGRPTRWGKQHGTLHQFGQRFDQCADNGGFSRTRIPLQDKTAIRPKSHQETRQLRENLDLLFGGRMRKLLD